MKRFPQYDEDELEAYDRDSVEPIVSEVNEDGGSPPIEGGGEYDLEQLFEHMATSSPFFQQFLAVAIQNDSFVQDLSLDQYRMFIRQNNIDNRLKRLEATAVTTPRPQISTTTANYINTNVAVNNEINYSLNRLLELKSLYGLEYGVLLRSGKDLSQITFSPDSHINDEVVRLLQKINVHAKAHNLTFKAFFNAN